MTLQAVESHIGLEGCLCRILRRINSGSVSKCFLMGMMLYVADVQYFNGGYWIVHIRECSYASAHKYCF